jgi:hypothetical protein
MLLLSAVFDRMGGEDMRMGEEEKKREEKRGRKMVA